MRSSTNPIRRDKERIKREPRVPAPGGRRSFTAVALDIAGEYDYVYDHNGGSTMGSYSVAEAKSGLPGLIDKASAGERVIITRHGRPVVELRPALPGSGLKEAGGLAWLGKQRRARPRISISSLAVLKDLAEEARW